MSIERTGSISKKIFRKDTIRHLAYLLEQESSDSDQLHFYVQAEDGSKQTSNSLSIFDDYGPLDIKRSKIIKLSFNDYKNHKHIEIDLEHGGNYYGDTFKSLAHNKYEIKGDDESWVLSTYVRLSEYIDSIETPNNFVINYFGLLWLFNIWGSGSLVWILAWYLLIKKHFGIGSPHPQPLPWLYTAGGHWLFITVIGLSLGSSLSSILGKLWPNIEFDFGPEHLKKEKYKRNTIWLFTTIIVIPFLIAIIASFFYDSLKH